MPAHIAVGRNSDEWRSVRKRDYQARTLAAENVSAMFSKLYS